MDQNFNPGMTDGRTYSLNENGQGRMRDARAVLPAVREWEKSY